MTIALCPGSFDSPTNGHIDVAERAARLFDKLIICVVLNPSKKSLFDPIERVALLKEALSHLSNTEIISHEGLLVDLARRTGALAIVKGLRAQSDVEYELQMAQMNSTLNKEVDTLFVSGNPKWSFLSSSLVKEVATLGADVSGFVPPGVLSALTAKMGKG